MIRPGRIALPFLALALGTTSLGCVHFHLERNAPGHVELAKPPPEGNHAPDRLQQPVDPGERMVVVSGGPFAAAGRRAGDLNGGVYSLGIETTVLVGEGEASHSEGELVYPQRAVGLNLGWTFAGSARSGGAPLYAEAQVFVVSLGAAAGWAFDPFGPGGPGGAQGPQATLSLGPLYTRMNWLVDASFTVQVGLVIKGWAAWVWSR